MQLVDFLSSGPVVAMVWEGKEVSCMLCGGWQRWLRDVLATHPHRTTPL
jgi:hypothetical protein